MRSPRGRSLTRRARIAQHAREADWLEIHRGEAPLLLSLPHTGTHIPTLLRSRFVSVWAAQRDADWWIDNLYGFARDLGATIVRTTISRSVIDVNRDPSGASLYPGQATTELCPTTNFDGDRLYVEAGPNEDEIAGRRDRWFTPYHAALKGELHRLRAMHDEVVLYDAHSIRSRIPRLFDGDLPVFNIGTNGGATCDPHLAAAIQAVCVESGRSHVLNGRFKGGWTTRRYGRPYEGVHAIQMELAMRSYLVEPQDPRHDNWPPPFDRAYAAQITDALFKILNTCIVFAQKGPS